MFDDEVVSAWRDIGHIEVHYFVWVYRVWLIQVLRQVFEIGNAWLLVLHLQENETWPVVFIVPLQSLNDLILLIIIQLLSVTRVGATLSPYQSFFYELLQKVGRIIVILLHKLDYWSHGLVLPVCELACNLGCSGKVHSPEQVIFIPLQFIHLVFVVLLYLLVLGASNLSNPWGPKEESHDVLVVKIAFVLGIGDYLPLAGAWHQLLEAQMSLNLQLFLQR